MNRFLQKLSQKGKVNWLKNIGLVIAGSGILLLILVKRVWNASDAVALTAFAVPILLGLGIYGWFQGQEKKKAEGEDRKIAAFLENTGLHLKAGFTVAQSVEKSRESLGDEACYEVIRAYLEDHTGPLVNSQRRRSLDALARAEGEKANAFLGDYLLSEAKEEKVEANQRISYLALGVVVLQMAVILIAVYASGNL